MDQATGNPFNGIKSITFSFYNTETGGSSIYYQTQEVNITNGVFSVSIGKGEGFYDGNLIEDGVPKEVFTKHAARYLGIKIENSQTEMFRHQFITSVAYAFKADEADRLSESKSQYLVPKGFIGMWSGSINSIPDGWALCDGTNGTPDLRERFVVGSASGINPGTTGGASSYSLSVDQLPSHTHTGSTNPSGDHSHSGSTDEKGKHSHSFNFLINFGNQNIWGGDKLMVDWRAIDQVSSSTGPSGDHTHDFETSSNGSHSHSFTTDAIGSGAPIDNRPAYYALAFIMKL